MDDKRSIARNIYLAIIASLVLHTLVLAVLYFIHPADQPEEEELILEADWIELDEPLFLPQDDPLLNQSAEVRNLIASANAEQSWDEVNYSKRSQDQMAEEVYNQLKALEAETFAKLQEGREETDPENGYDEAKPESSDESKKKKKDDYSWFGEERSYGAATVEFDLKGREGMKLPPPAYRCKGQGKVVVSVEVGQDGLVTKAEIIQSTVQSECLEEEALRYAERSVFSKSLSAPRKQVGTITYRFVAQ